MVQVDFREHICHQTRSIARELGAHDLAHAHVGEDGGRHRQLLEPRLSTRSQIPSQSILIQNKCTCRRVWRVQLCWVDRTLTLTNNNRSCDAKPSMHIITNASRISKARTTTQTQRVNTLCANVTIVAKSIGSCIDARAHSNRK